MNHCLGTSTARASLCLGLWLAGCPVQAAEVTLITHGYESTPVFPTWVAAMADQIPACFSGRFPGANPNGTTYRLVITPKGSGYQFSTTRTNGLPPTATQSGEIMIELDWSSLSGDTGDSYASTYNVAAAVSQVLMQTNAIAELNGHALVEFPIHLMGHSRGGSLVSQISYILGTNGLWVDQVTSLDPHPVNNDGNSDFLFSYQDAPANQTYANVLFADDYWQELGDPTGEAVAGAYVRQLTDLDGGYNYAEKAGGDHSNVHLWYFGTLDLNTPASDTTAGITSRERSAWWAPYEDQGATAGFIYSRLGGGNRTNTVIPLGSANAPAIVSGFNQFWNLGGGTTANRTALPMNSGAWPNVIQFTVAGTNVVSQGNPVSTALYYQYGGSSPLTLQLYLDPDFNPFNSNNIPVLSLQPPASGTGSVAYYPSLACNTTAVPPGLYAVFARISDGTHTRYLYAPQQVQIMPKVTPPSLAIVRSAGSQVVVDVSAVAGQKITLQASLDLKNWTPVATNTLVTNGWLYLTRTAASQQYFRALLSQ